MAHPHDQDDELPVHDVVNDPVVSNAQPVTVVVSGELPDVGIREPRIVPQPGVSGLVSAACGSQMAALELDWF
jgi:hypothetical protein